MRNRFKYIVLVLLLGCFPYEEIGEFKTVLLEQGESIVEVSAAMGTHSRMDATYNFVFIVDGYGDSVTCEIVILEFDSLLETIKVPIRGKTYEEIWSKTSFHTTRVPDLGWSARLK